MGQIGCDKTGESCQQMNNLFNNCKTLDDKRRELYADLYAAVEIMLTEEMVEEYHPSKVWQRDLYPLWAKLLEGGKDENDKI